MIAKIKCNSKVPNGKIVVSGAKNAATILQSASLISDEKITLTNFPTELVDADYKLKFIQNVGGLSRFDYANELCITEPGELSGDILETYEYPIRTTYLLVPGLLKRAGIARIPYPGGCKIGNRGYDLHIMVWESMGAVVSEEESYIEVRAKILKGTEIDFPISTIGGTETALICGSIAEGVTIIRNAYISPEVENLISFLRDIGVNLKVIGNSYIEIRGSDYLRGTTFEIIPDRIEALTWIVYGILSGANIIIEKVPFNYMEVPLIHIRNTGIDFFNNSSSIFITPDCVIGGIQPFEIATGTYPGIISDMQPFFVLLGMKANGKSRINDYRYPERINYLTELSKFCNNGLNWEKGKITINGPCKFEGASVSSTDLRGSMALVLASLLADKGESIINGVEMALRGYNRLQEKLSSLGISIEIINDEESYDS